MPNVALPDERAAEAARRDLLDGLKLWKLWGRMCWSELKRRYRRTLLGPFWLTAAILVFALALSLVWSRLWNIGVSDYLPYLLSGLIPWTMVSASVGEACTAFIANETLMKSRQFPYSVLVYVVVARNGLILLHHLAAYALVAVLCGVTFTAYTLIAIPGIVLLATNLGWIGMAVAILCLRYRDVQQLVQIGLQTALLVTPIFWPADRLAGAASLVVELNPVFYLVDIVRSPLLGRAVEASSLVIVALTAAAGWASVQWLLIRKRHRIAYWF